MDYGDSCIWSHFAVVDPIKKAVKCRSDLRCVCEVEQVVGSPRMVREDGLLEDVAAGNFEGRTCCNNMDECFVLVFLAKPAEGIDFWINFILKVC